MKIAKCVCGADSGTQIDTDNRSRRYCYDSNCGIMGQWRRTSGQANAVWNDLVGGPSEPSVTWTTETAEAIGGSWFVSVTDAAGYTVGGAGQKLDAKYFGALADSLQGGRYTLTITAKRVAPPEEPAEPQSKSQERRPLSPRLDAVTDSVNDHTRSLANHRGRLDELEAQVDLVMSVLESHRTSTAFAGHKPTEPTPDVEPECPEDCKMVALLDARAHQVALIPIENGYGPDVIALYGQLFRRSEVAGTIGYYSRGSVTVVTLGKPLRPEASGD